MSQFLGQLTVPVVSALPGTGAPGQVVVLASTSQFFKWQTVGGSTGWMAFGIQTDGTQDLPVDYTSSQPAVPTSGLSLFARRRGGQHRPAWINPDGYHLSAQSFLGRQKVRRIAPIGGSTTISTDGVNASTQGTVTARTPALTSFFNAANRVGFVTAATAAGSTAGVRSGGGQVGAGAGTGSGAYGGFEFVCRFGISATATSMRVACGLFNNTAVLTNQDVSANTNMLCIGKDAADTVFSVMCNGTGTAVKTSLGANFPANTAGVDLYEFACYCPPGSTTYQWSVTRLNTGDYAEGTFTSGPAAGVILAPQLWCTNGTVLTAAAVDLVGMYLETDT